MTLDHRYQILQSIPRAMVCGQCLYLTDGTIVWTGVTSGTVFLSSDGHLPDCTHDPEIYSAIKEALSKLDPPKEWREKIIQLIETAELSGPSNDLKNGDVGFFRSLSEDYVNMWRKGVDVTVTLHSPEFIGAADARRTELLRAKRRAKDDAQLEAIERILS